MKIVFKKTHDHICHNCNTQFNFIKGKSLYFGKLEYRTRTERDRVEKYFCSDECASNYNQNNKR